MPLVTGSRHTIYAAVNYVFAPAPVLTPDLFLRFQGALGTHGVTFDQASKGDTEWSVVRQKTPLQAQIKLPQAPAGQLAPPLGQLLIVGQLTGQQADYDVASFVEDAEGVCQAVLEVWPGGKQVLVRDATIRQLYDAGGQTGFQFLWEERLGQKASQFEMIGRPVMGGGLRLVMPPADTGSGLAQGEVHIESFLQDPRKIFVQVTMAWPQPWATESFNPQELIAGIEGFANGDLVDFMTLKGDSK